MSEPRTSNRFACEEVGPYFHFYDKNICMQGKTHWQHQYNLLGVLLHFNIYWMWPIHKLWKYRSRKRVRLFLYAINFLAWYFHCGHRNSIFDNFKTINPHTHTHKKWKMKWKNWIYMYMGENGKKGQKMCNIYNLLIAIRRSNILVLYFRM